METRKKRILFILSQNDIGGHTKVVLNLIKIFDKRNIYSEVYIPWFTHFFYTKKYRLRGDYSDAYIWIRYFLGQIKSELISRRFKWRGQSLQITPVKIKRFIFSPSAEYIKLFDVIIITSHFQLEELSKLNVDMSKVIYIIHHVHSNNSKDFEILMDLPQLRIIVSSDRTAEECKNLGLRNFSICNLGVDLKMFNPSKRNRAIDNVIRVGFFYYNHPRKNPRLIESVIAIFNREHPDIEIYIFGNGFNNAGGNVILTEGINEHTYAESIANLDLFVYISKIEGFGLPPLEAMASGVPVIASDVGAVTSYMKNGVNGIILENDCSATNIVNSIERVLRNRNLKNRFSENGVLASQNWSWSKTCDDYLVIFEDINE